MARVRLDYSAVISWVSAFNRDVPYDDIFSINIVTRLLHRNSQAAGILLSPLDDFHESRQKWTLLLLMLMDEKVL